MRLCAGRALISEIYCCRVRKTQRYCGKNYLRRHVPMTDQCCCQRHGKWLIHETSALGLINRIRSSASCMDRGISCTPDIMHFYHFFHISSTSSTFKPIPGISHRASSTTAEPFLRQQHSSIEDVALPIAQLANVPPKDLPSAPQFRLNNLYVCDCASCQIASVGTSLYIPPPHSTLSTWQPARLQPQGSSAVPFPGCSLAVKESPIDGARGLRGSP